MVKVVLENLTKKFGNQTVVDEINLEIRDKEFMVLLGPSGCGKTTTLNMIAGLESITSGNIYFDGTLMNDVPPEKRDIAMVFQSYALYPNMKVFDNIAFPLEIRKLPKSEIVSQVNATAEMLRIKNLLDKRPYELSGGERQRVALARAVVRKPKAFLLDEPLSNIDAKLRVYMRAELIRLQKELKTTMIYVTHDQVEAMSMADRIAIMSEGKLIQVADPLTIFDHPANQFVGGFIGTPPMNFFDCQYKTIGEESYLQLPTVKLRIDKELGKMIEEQAKGPELVIGVRPQDIGVSNKKSSDEDFEVEVYAVEPLGTETILDICYVACGQVFKAATTRRFMANIGDMLWASLDKQRIHIFDKVTQKAIV
ncbi:MAG: ABC transporter ATP-binding protein [Nitrososphaeria archaeon]